MALWRYEVHHFIKAELGLRRSSCCALLLRKHWLAVYKALVTHDDTAMRSRETKAVVQCLRSSYRHLFANPLLGILFHYFQPLDMLYIL